MIHPMYKSDKAITISVTYVVHVKYYIEQSYHVITSMLIDYKKVYDHLENISKCLDCVLHVS